jgi:maleylacetoacetate isomerase
MSSGRTKPAKRARFSPSGGHTEEISVLRLHTYFRSSAAYRVRIALNLKNLSYQHTPVHLRRDGGQQHSPSFVRLSPAHLVPVLQEEELSLTQSLAIIEYLEETHPSPPLLPKEADARARVRALALSIACDIHPLANLRVLQYLETQLEVDEAARGRWSRHWLELGLGAIEQLLATDRTGQSFCYGDSPTLADCCLIPQVFNALRAECSLSPYPTIQRIYAHCTALTPFQNAAPGVQEDAE